MLHAWHDSPMPPSWKAHTPASTPKEDCSQLCEQALPQRHATRQKVRSRDAPLHPCPAKAGQCMTLYNVPCRFCRTHRMVSSRVAAGQTAEVDSAARSTSRHEMSGNGAARETAALTFQEAIARLQSYWASVGCAVWQPFNSEVLLMHDSETLHDVIALAACQHMCLFAVSMLCSASQRTVSEPC